MSNPKGNPGNKGGGRRTLMEEIENYKDRITDEALSKLARTKLVRHMETIEDNDRSGVKEIVLPVCLKGMTDRKDVTSGGLPIVLPSEIIRKHNLDQGDK